MEARSYGPEIAATTGEILEMLMTDEEAKNIKDPKKEKESPELKEELTDEELKGVSGGKRARCPGTTDLIRGWK